MDDYVLVVDYWVSLPLKKYYVVEQYVAVCIMLYIGGVGCSENRI